MTDQSRWTMRCTYAGVLIENWDRLDRVNGRLPASAFRCQPCHLGDTRPWLVRFGYHESVVHAGCRMAACMTVYRRVNGKATPGSAHSIRDRWHDIWRSTAIDARPATPADVARFDRMVTEQEAGARG